MTFLKKYSKVLASLIFTLLVITFVLVFSKAGTSVSQPDIVQRLSNKDQTIVWGIKNDTKLFGFYNIENGEIEGFDIDVAKELTKRLTGDSKHAKFVEVTSKTRIPLLRNGNIDAIIATMTINEARKKVVDFTDTYFDAGQSLLVAKDSKINSIDNLDASTTVVSVKGSTSSQNIKKLAPQAKLIELETYAEGLTALKAGQGDALTTDNAILLGLISENPDFRLAGENFTEEPYGIAVNKNQADFKNQLNQALAAMKADGTYQKIYDKWFAEVLNQGGN
ncbi:transporter substrate-binding domain-containing protein [Eremococcus coleocola]|uniref:ABC transporter glutamine-binding protein GlnH n=1 Tax=Eremococcus coleocola ACS-139-V-Col8 TaxID=908337 RepID=E4KRD4_9LACT|nr:transporter substrate-binding domain-containing protein [Eremococcus coleocola]EFR30465.1 ABC transporter glutamine-binding protein GlnH [Eremococcus coleocola ACS-139-V-Col8]